MRDDISELARRAIMQARVPPTIVVGAEGTVLFMHGEVRPYLHFPDGQPNLTSTSVIAPDLEARVQDAIDECRRVRTTIAFICLSDRGEPRTRITVTPAFEIEDAAVLVTFEKPGATLLESEQAAGLFPGAVEALVESEQSFQRTFDQAAVGIAHMSLDGTWLRVNDGMLQIAGYDRSDLLAMTWQELTHPDDLEKAIELGDALIAGRLEEYTLEKRYVRKDGTWVWVNVTSSLVRNRADEPLYLISVIEDISYRKRAEEELKESEWRFRQTLINSPVPMLVYDDKGIITAQSKSWSRLTGYAPEQIQTIDAWARTLGRQRAQELRAVLSRSLEHDTVGEAVESEIWARDGEKKTLLFSGASLGKSRKGRRLWICAAADVTGQKQAEEELLEANRQKDQYLAMLGHELRNPLAAVRNASELLKLMHPDDARLQRTRAILERQTTHMAKLLDDLLDVSRIIRGKIALDREIVDFASMLRETLRDSEERFAKQGLVLETSIGNDPVCVTGDPVRLTQIVDNLLSNALKYTERGGTITLCLEADADRMLLTVRDTGIGIEAELLPYVFEAFRQSRQSLDRSDGGLGLGLALVKSLAELHGGSVAARSAGRGRGSEFVLTLPVTRDGHVASQSPITTPPAARILIVEDNEDALEMLRQSVEMDGHDVRVATRGRDAIGLAQQERPDLVLCDLGLPEGITGFDVARALRRNESTRDIFLVALTGYGRPEDRARSAQAGFDAHITKPVSIATLRRVVLDAQRTSRI